MLLLLKLPVVVVVVTVRRIREDEPERVNDPRSDRCSSDRGARIDGSLGGLIERLRHYFATRLPHGETPEGMDQIRINTGCTHMPKFDYTKKNTEIFKDCQRRPPKAKCQKRKFPGKQSSTGSPPLYIGVRLAAFEPRALAAQRVPEAREPLRMLVGRAAAAAADGRDPRLDRSLVRRADCKSQMESNRPHTQTHTQSRTITSLLGTVAAWSRNVPLARAR
jgi:hypothetical protein